VKGEPAAAAAAAAAAAIKLTKNAVWHATNQDSSECLRDAWSQTISVYNASLAGVDHLQLQLQLLYNQL
jgi:DNA-binding protein Fis